MAQEIERKFLVDADHPKLAALLKQTGTEIRQAYFIDPSRLAVHAAGGIGTICIDRGADGLVCISVPEGDALAMIHTLCPDSDRETAVTQGVARIRIAGPDAWLTLKGKTSGISRAEFEYPIAREVAETLLQECGSVLRKTRRLWALPDGLVAEVDSFEQIDLVIAEVELTDPDTAIEHPDWFLEEVSDDHAYFNNAIAARLE